MYDVGDAIYNLHHKKLKQKNRRLKTKKMNGKYMCSTDECGIGVHFLAEQMKISRA